MAMPEQTYDPLAGSRWLQSLTPVRTRTDGDGGDGRPRVHNFHGMTPALAARAYERVLNRADLESHAREQIPVAIPIDDPMPPQTTPARPPEQEMPPAPTQAAPTVPAPVPPSAPTPPGDRDSADEDIQHLMATPHNPPAPTTSVPSTPDPAPASVSPTAPSTGPAQPAPAEPTSVDAPTTSGPEPTQRPVDPEIARKYPYLFGYNSDNGVPAQVGSLPWIIAQTEEKKSSQADATTEETVDVTESVEVIVTPLPIGTGVLASGPIQGQPQALLPVAPVAPVLAPVVATTTGGVLGGSAGAILSGGAAAGGAASGTGLLLPVGLGIIVGAAITAGVVWAINSSSDDAPPEHESEDPDTDETVIPLLWPTTPYPDVPEYGTPWPFLDIPSHPDPVEPEAPIPDLDGNPADNPALLPEHNPPPLIPAVDVPDVLPTLPLQTEPLTPNPDLPGAPEDPRLPPQFDPFQTSPNGIGMEPVHGPTPPPPPVNLPLLHRWKPWRPAPNPSPFPLSDPPFPVMPRAESAEADSYTDNNSSEELAAEEAVFELEDFAGYWYDNDLYLSSGRQIPTVESVGRPNEVVRAKDGEGDVLKASDGKVSLNRAYEAYLALEYGFSIFLPYPNATGRLKIDEYVPELWAAIDFKGYMNWKPADNIKWQERHYEWTLGGVVDDMKVKSELVWEHFGPDYSVYVITDNEHVTEAFRFKFRQEIKEQKFEVLNSGDYLEKLKQAGVDHPSYGKSFGEFLEDNDWL